jgi:hypothetical protein
VVHVPTYTGYLKETEFFDDNATATERLSPALADEGCENEEQWQLI